MRRAAYRSSAARDFQDPDPVTDNDSADSLMRFRKMKIYAKPEVKGRARKGRIEEARTICKGQAHQKNHWQRRTERHGYLAGLCHGDTRKLAAVAGANLQ